MPALSVVIPTWNRLAMLKQCVASLPPTADLEIIVVDDGSTDGTREWLADQPGIRTVLQSNAGPGPARNAGAVLASAPYLAFLDSDDLWFPWTLDTYRAVIARTGAAFITATPRFFESHDELTLAHPPSADKEVRWESFQDYLDSGDAWRWWGCSSFLIERSAFLAAGGFRDQHMNGEDADLALRLGLARGFVHIQKPETFAYRRHSSGETGIHRHTLTGALEMLDAERRGAYPGGDQRRRERERIIGRHLRPIALACLVQGNRDAAWTLYAALFRSQLRGARWRFLFGFLWRFCLSHRPSRLPAS